MATFVLVPGMWHGSWCWKRVTPLLRAAGCEVHLVTLTGLGERAHLHYPDIDMNTHIQDVVGVLEFEDLREVILVGHSLSGFMVPAIAERSPQRIAHLINLDGVLPESNKAFKDLRPAYWADFQRHAQASGDVWWAPPHPDWTFGVTGDDLEWLRSSLTPHPLRAIQTPLVFNNPAARTIPRTYISCTEGYASEDVAKLAQDCASLGWAFRTLSAGHDAMITAPVALAELLLEFV